MITQRKACTGTRLGHAHSVVEHAAELRTHARQLAAAVVMMGVEEGVT